MSVEQFETEVLELGVRKVRTPEGSDKYGLPIGAIITPDAEAAAQAKGYTDPVPEDKVSGPRAKGGFMSVGTISGKAQAGKNAPKPAKGAEPQKLKLKISKPSIKGNKVFMVGKSKYSAPNGSKLIRPANQPGMAYVVTPEGKVHAFNEAGEITIPDTLKSVFEAKFNDTFEGDENYSIEEFDATAAPYSMDQLKAGAVLNDKDGTPQFKKLGPDSWEHVDLGVQLKDEDLKQLYEEGDLVPEQTDDAAASEEVFSETEATDFPSLSIDEAEAALDSMKPGQKLTLKTSEDKPPAIFEKQEDGSWLNPGKQVDGSPYKPTPANTLAVLKGFLSMGEEQQDDEPDPEKVKSAITGEKPVAKLAPKGPGIKDYEAALDELPEGHQVHVKDSSATLTKQSDGGWKSSVTGETLTSKQTAILGNDLEDGPSPTSKPEAAQPAAERAKPKRKKPTTLRSTTKLKAGEGDYSELAKPEQMAVATIGDRVLVNFAGGEMASEYELTQDEVWANVDDPEDVFGKKTMAAMVQEQGSDQVYINAKKQSKPLSDDSGAINYKSALDTNEILYDGTTAYDVESTESEFYVEPGYAPFTDETSIEDIEKAKPGDKILVGYDPDFEEEMEGTPNYIASEVVEKQEDGSWKNLTYPNAAVTEEGLLADVVSSDGQFQASQLYTMSGNSTKVVGSPSSGVSSSDGGKKNVDQDGPAGGNAGTGGPGGVAEESQPGLGGVDGPGDSDGDGVGVQLADGSTPALLNDGKPMPSNDRIEALKAKGLPVAEVYELDSAQSADVFRDSISALKENNPYAASVYVYEQDEYANMRLFLNSDGTAGFALKDDEVVSVFVRNDSKDKGSAQSLMAQAVALGGTRLDAYDTVLPKLYAKEGFVAVARTPWNDEYAPEGWDKETYAKYNGGSPDVVFMKYDPAALDSTYNPTDGVVVDDYDQGVALAKGESAPAAPQFPLISDTANAKKIGGQAGSNAGGLYELTMPDGTKQKYYVKKAQSEDHGKNEALANALYRELGINVPEVDFASDGNLYSKIVDGEQDMQARLNDKEWLDKVREGFAIDAWLSNRDVFGLTYDNILTDGDGNPWRIDNGGALRYRAMGEKKTDFGPEVTELEVFRTGKKKSVYGPDMTIAQEQASAQKIADLSPERIKELVAEYGMDADMEQTLLARRDFIMEQYGVFPKNPTVKEPVDALTLVPEGSKEFPKNAVPDIPVGATVYEVTPNGNVLKSVKLENGAYNSDLGDGLMVESTFDEVFGPGPDKNKFFWYSESLAAPGAGADAPKYEQGQNLTADELDGLPVGAMVAYVTYEGKNVPYTRIDEKTWNSEVEGVASHYSFQTAASQQKVRFVTMDASQGVPVMAPKVWKQGDKPATLEDITSLPPATVLAYQKNDGTTSYYTKLDSGMWLSPSGNPISAGLIADHAEKGKFTVASKLGEEPSVPDADLSFGYSEGDTITKMGHVNQFPVGQVLAMENKDGSLMNLVIKTEDGWRAPDDDPDFPGMKFEPGDLGDAIQAKRLKYVAPSVVAEETQPSTTLDKQLWSGAPAMSEAQLSEALTSMETATAFQVKYSLKGISASNPLTDESNQEQLKTAALNKYPDLKVKPAVVKYLKDVLGVEEGGDTSVDDTTMVRLGSKDPKSTGVQGVDGGEFSVTDIKNAIDILESYNGKLFKAELNKKGNPLGTLNPNSLVGFDKDKTVVKQKVIDLLKSKLIRTEEAIKHPKIKSMEEFNELPVGAVVSIKNKEGAVTNFTKVSESQWRDEDDNPFPSSIFKYAIDTNDLRLEKLPDVLPDYAKTPASVQEKGVSEEEVSVFTAGDLEEAAVGTEIVGVNDDGSPMLWKKTSNVAYPWDNINPETGEHILNWNSAEVAAIWDKNQIKLKQIDGPNFNENAAEGIVPGKYESKTGKAYMVVNADGSGVYVNSKGTVSKLSKNAVKKNYEAGVNSYKGIPESTPTPGTSTAPVKKPVTVANLGDGTYFAGDPNNPKTVVYEVSGDKAKVFKPNTGMTAATGVKLGKEPNSEWLSQAGVGASYYAGGVHYTNPETEEKEYIPSVTFTKGADGLWTGTQQSNSNQPPVVVIPPTDTPPKPWYSKVKNHGLSDPVELPKTKVNTLFSQGNLLDQYGNSVLPDGYTGGLMFLGKPNTVPGLAKALTTLKGLQELDEIQYSDYMGVLSGDGLAFDNVLLTKWRQANGFDTEVTIKTNVDVLAAVIEKQLEGLDLTPPESNATELFDWNEMGHAKFPAVVAATQYDTYGHASLGNYIKTASASIGGGKVIGQHLTKMNKYDRQAWISAFKEGNFKKMYALEVNAAALEGKPHNSGFLHPGYEGNEATNKILWAPAVDGEKPAAETIEGDWTDSSSGLTPSMQEIDNYLISAQMQNPTYLNPQEKRQWVRWHRQGNQQQVDVLSSMAQQRKLDGVEELSSPISWTDDIVPPKLYDQVFENDPTPWPTGNAWKVTSYQTTEAWAKDNKNNEDFKAFYTQSFPDYDPDTVPYTKHEAVVAAYFDMKRDEYETELLKPVYTKTNLIGKGSHEVWDAEDQFGRKYIFKPADSPGYLERLKMEAKANDLARAWGFPAAKSIMVELDGQTGMMQEKIPSESSFHLGGDAYLQVPTLNNKQLAQLSAEHVLDWMLDNDDNHADNMLVKSDGSLAGIDKGRAFYVYGNWPGLTGDDKAHTVFSDRSEHSSLVYTYLYDDIRAGKLTPEQVEAAYFGARKAAQRIQKSSDAAVEQMVRDAVEGRTNWSVPDYMTHFEGKAPQNADELVAAVLARKNALADQIDEMWGRIYKEAGLGDLPQAPPKVFENHISGWDEPELIQAATEAKVWGAAGLHASAAIVDGNSLLWTEQSASGEELHKGKLTVGSLTQQQLVSFLDSKSTPIGISSNAPLYLTDFPNTSEWKSAITGAGKEVTKNSVTKEYDAEVLKNFEAVKAKLQGDAFAWSLDMEVNSAGYATFPSGLSVPQDALPQYKQMLNHYLGMADNVDEAIATGGTTDKSQFSLFQAVAPKPNPKVITSPEGHTYTEMANGQWLFLGGSEAKFAPLPVDQNALPEGWFQNAAAVVAGTTTTYNKIKAASKGGKLGEGGIKVEDSKVSGQLGHHGTEFQIVLPSGEEILFRNADATNTARSQQGTISFTLAGDNKEASLSRVRDQLELMGLDMAGASEDSAEVTYWRAMFNRLLFSKASSTGKSEVKLALSKLKIKGANVKTPQGKTPSDWEMIEAIGLSMEPGEEQAFWRGLAEEAFGTEKVSAWISEQRYLPKFQHMDLSDPTKATGKPYYERIDVTEEELLAKGSLIATGNSSKDEGLLKYITSGGLLSTEERLRILGYFKTGASSSEDQNTGGANSVFTRIASKGKSVETYGSIFGSHVAYWSPAALAQVGTYSYSSDQYGRLSDMQGSNPATPLKALSDFDGSSNETMVSNALSIYDYLEIMVFEDATKRNEAIQRMKALGLEVLRGLPIEERLVMRVNLQDALKKVKAQWTT